MDADTPFSRKVLQPYLPPTILHRSSLIEELRARIEEPSSICKLVLLCAPAGYGKTTLLADFSTHTHTSCCWYFLESSDNDISTFLEILIISIRQRFPQFGKELDIWLTYARQAGLFNSTETQHLDTFIDKFVAASKSEIDKRFAIFICNYHEIHMNEQINTLINRLLKYLPSHCVIAIESRAIPVLEFVSLISRYQMFSIGSNVLSFTVQEIQSLAQILQVRVFSDEEATSLREAFGGWIAGILLGTRLGQAQFLSYPNDTLTTWSAPAIRMDRQSLFTYLANEVFKREPEIYAFLKETSILQRMTPEICNALLSITNAEEELKYIEKQGLFITHIEDSSHSVYIYHPILREILYEALCNQDSLHVTSLHRHAADLYFALQDYEQAIFHALAAGANDFAAHLILEGSQSISLKGQVETLARWIDTLPTSTLERSPQLLLARANINLAHKETSKALPLLEKALELVDDPTTALDLKLIPHLRAEILVAQSVVWFETGAYVRSQQLCEQALQHLAADEVEIRAQAYQRLGMCASLLNDSANGILYMQQALQFWGRQTERMEIALLHGYLANAYNLSGNYTLAEHHRSRAIDSCTRLGNKRGLVNNLVGMAITKRYKGILDEAETLLNEARLLARELRFLKGEAYVLENLGEIYLEQNRLGEALTVTEDAFALAQQVGDSYLGNHVLCSLSMIYLSMGDLQTASLLVHQTMIKAAPSLSYENSLRELTRGTVLLFQQQYQAAYDCLSTLKVALQETGLKRLYLRTLIRLAVCQLFQGHEDETISTLEELLALAQAGSYEHLMQVEFRRFPQLLQEIKTLPQATALRTRLAPYIVNTEPAPSVAAVREVEAEMRILGFGEPAILINGTPVTHWRMARSMELYFLLLDSNHPLRKEQIIDALWPEVDDSVQQTLRSTVFYLRKAIGEACIIYKTGSYMLDLASVYGENVWYDVAIFQKDSILSKEYLEVEDDRAAQQVLREMVELYRGDYVQSFFNDWSRARREELRSTYIEARRSLALIAWRAGEIEESIVHWQHMLALDNCLEDVHGWLIRCYLRQGKRGLALRQYQRCVEILQRELSVSPGPALSKLYQHLSGN